MRCSSPCHSYVEQQAFGVGSFPRTRTEIICVQSIVHCTMGRCPSGPRVLVLPVLARSVLLTITFCVSDALGSSDQSNRRVSGVELVWNESVDTARWTVEYKKASPCRFLSRSIKRLRLELDKYGGVGARVERVRRWGALHGVYIT